MTGFGTLPFMYCTASLSPLLVRKTGTLFSSVCRMVPLWVFDIREWLESSTSILGVMTVFKTDGQSYLCHHKMLPDFVLYRLLNLLVKCFVIILVTILAYHLWTAYFTISPLSYCLLFIHSLYFVSSASQGELLVRIVSERELLESIALASECSNWRLQSCVG